MDSNAVCPAAKDRCRPRESDARSERLEGDNGEHAVARSERNVREWRTYLSPECVESMIRMGWHTST
jgi:hypothetical protein